LKILANTGAVAGDRLLLTKALGTGVISTAIKKGTAKESWIDSAVASMTTLNKAAAEVVTGAELRSAAQTATCGLTWAVHSMTDITGFGLIGHAREMARGSNVSLRMYASRVHSQADIRASRHLARMTDQPKARDVSLRMYASRVPVLDGAFECIR